MTRRALFWAVSAGVVGASVAFAGVGPVRTFLLPVTSISSPVEGELAHDLTKDEPVIRAAGKWRSLLPRSSERFPDFWIQAATATVSAGSVRFSDDVVLTNSGPTTYAISDNNSWKALFAVPSTVPGEFTVVSSTDFNQPTGVDPGVISQGHFRYLGSYLGARALSRQGSQYTYVFSGNELGATWDWTVTSAPLVRWTNLPPLASTARLQVKLYAPGRLVTDTAGINIYASTAGLSSMPATPAGGHSSEFVMLPDSTGFGLKVALETSGMGPEPAASVHWIGHSEDLGLFEN